VARAAGNHPEFQIGFKKAPKSSLPFPNGDRRKISLTRPACHRATVQAAQVVGCLIGSEEATCVVVVVHAVAAARFFSVYQASARSFVAKPRDDMRLPLIMIRACHFFRNGLTPTNPVLLFSILTNLSPIWLGYVLGLKKKRPSQSGQPLCVCAGCFT
jgi:hypothetical protein